MAEPADGSERVSRRRLWLVILAFSGATLAGAFEFKGIGTITPTIAAAFNSGQISNWIGPAYALAEMAFTPLACNLAYVFGRSWTFVAFIAVFALGCALSSAAQNGAALIAGRVIAGAGHGGIYTLPEIILCDLVPLNQRGNYSAVISSIWSIASFAGPPLAGAAALVTWRLAFWLALPVSGTSIILLPIVLRKLKTPRTNTRERLARIDWLGNALFVAATASLVLGLTNAGTSSWSSARVLCPLLLGAAAYAPWIWTQARLANPTIPLAVFRSRTANMAFLLEGLISVSIGALTYLGPAMFRGLYGDNSLRAGYKFLALTGSQQISCLGVKVAMSHTSRYRPMIYVSLTFLISGLGGLSTVTPSSSPAVWVSSSVVAGLGSGAFFALPVRLLQPDMLTDQIFPLLAALPPKLGAAAMTARNFVGGLGLVIGIAVGNTITQDRLRRELPASLVQPLLDGQQQITFGLINRLSALDAPTQALVHDAMGAAFRALWLSIAGICGLGLLATLFMAQLELHAVTDEDWGFETDPCVSEK